MGGNVGVGFVGGPERFERHIAVSYWTMNATLPHEIGHTFGLPHSDWEEKTLMHSQADENENTYNNKNAKLLTERRFAYAAHSPIDTCGNDEANKQCQADDVYKACQLNNTVFGLERKLDAYLKASSGLECACKCDQYTFCHSWSFSNVYKFCWLRGVDQLTTQFKSPNGNYFVSGLKSCFVNTSPTSQTTATTSITTSTTTTTTTTTLTITSSPKRTPDRCYVSGRARIGSDLKIFFIDRRDANICSEKCMENNACVAWNYWTGD